MMRYVRWALLGGPLVGPVVAVLLAWQWPLLVEGGDAVLFGWFHFLARTLPRVRPGVSEIVCGCVYVGLFLLLLHFVMRWIVLAASVPSERRVWRWRWTAMVAAAAVLMFAVTLATIGLARHVGWMLTSPDPWTTTLEVTTYKVEE